MFQWADGGSLRDFYRDNPRPTLDTKFIQEIVLQLFGLASALNKLHNYKKDDNSGESYRHGDLKPENILRFTSENGTRVGMLKISDLGLAKHHLLATRFRDLATDTHFGTPLYEPPEVYTEKNSPRSRQYDIWSMGCIILELIIWLLYGYEELVKFNNSMKYALGGNSSPYWVLDESRTEAHAKVHPHVTESMKIVKRDPECLGAPTAIGDLLKLVERRLLVVRLPQHTALPSRQQTVSRAKAEELHRALGEMVRKGNSDKSYWSRGGNRMNLPGLVDSIQPSAISQKRANLNVPVLEPRKEVSIDLLSFFFSLPLFIHGHQVHFITLWKPAYANYLRYASVPGVMFSSIMSFKTPTLPR